MDGLEKEEGENEVPKKEKKNLPILTGIIVIFFALLVVLVNLVKPKSSPAPIPSEPIPTFEPTPAVEISLIPTEKPVPTPQKTSVISPGKFGFTKPMELKDVGVRANFTEETRVFWWGDGSYVAKVEPYDSVYFFLKDYDGGGRRAWFQKEYKLTGYTFQSFSGLNHSGYISYQADTSKNFNNYKGYYYYFTAVSPKKMLVIHGINDIASKKGVYFGGDLEKFRSFLSTVEITTVQKVNPEAFNFTNVFRWSNERKTVWEDANLGIKILAPEWTESRYTRERDAEGKFIYSDWTRTYPEAKIYDSAYISEPIKRVEITGGWLSMSYLSILPEKFQNKSFTEVVNELLFPAGFCATEWKPTKSDCPSQDYCYTKEEVTQNLILIKEDKIGSLEAQLRGMNEEFSNKNDCRSEQLWLVRAKNGLYLISNLSPSGDLFRLEPY